MVGRKALNVVGFTDLIGIGEIELGVNDDSAARRLASVMAWIDKATAEVCAEGHPVRAVVSRQYRATL